MDLTTTQSAGVALLIALVLAGLHVAAPRIRKLPFVPERATGSFAGGLAVAYGFLHLQSEIAEGNEAIGEALSGVVEPTPRPPSASSLSRWWGSPPSMAWSGWPIGALRGPCRPEVRSRRTGRSRP